MLDGTPAALTLLRMESAPDNAANRCPRCGRDNRCGIAGNGPCWCAVEFERALAVPKQGEACYCRNCLTELIEERRRAHAQ